MPTDAAVMQWLAQFAEVSESREILDRLVTVVDGSPPASRTSRTKSAGSMPV